MREFKPKGVELFDPDDFGTQRTHIFDKVHDAVKTSFPRSFGGVRMELKDSTYEGPEDFSPEEQKQALLNNKFLGRRLRGTLQLFDDKTNDVLDEQRVTLMNVPWLSPRGTFLHGGSNYTAVRQLRLVPGPYGRVMNNGNTEVHFNVRPGSGSGYRVMLEPETAQFKLKVGKQSEVHLYSVLKDMGVQDDHIKGMWGDGTWERNAKKYNPKAFQQAYVKLVPTREQLPDAPRVDQVKQLRAAFDRSQILASVRDQHLPTMADTVKRAALGRELATTDKDYEDLEKAFKPDFTPEDLTDVKNAIYGKSGPQLASMKQWPDAWINKDVDPMGWLEWYDNYAGGRRSEDDARQIQRWLRFKRRAGAQYVQNPTARRGHALRNWGIDAPTLLPQERQEAARKDMDAHKAQAWGDWAAKRASLTRQDLIALARYINQQSQAALPLEGTVEELEQAISIFLTRPDNPDAGNDAMLAASSLFKTATIAHMMARHPEDFQMVFEAGDNLKIKYANSAQACTVVATPFMEVLGCLI
jgi:DNA-directed RNA polymerase beta subunit